MLKRCLFVLLLLPALTSPAHAVEALVLDDFVLYADSEIELEKIADSTGNVGSNGRIDIKKGKSGTLTGDIRAVDRIKNEGKIFITGNVLTAARIYNRGSLTVSGQSVEETDLPSLVLPTLSFTAEGSDIDVPRGAQEQLAPGSYGRIEVNRGAALALTSGVYNMAELDTEKHAVVTIDAAGGPVTVNIAERLDIDEEVEIRIINGTTRDITFNFSGAKKVDIEKKGIFRGSLIAPHAKVEFDKNSRLEGMVIAAFIKLKSGTRFQPHENATPVLSVVADAGVDRTVKVGDKVILDGSASFTTSGNPLSFQWSLVSYPAGSQPSISDPTAVAPELVFDQIGIYTAELSVRDGEVASEPDTVMITAAPSHVNLDDFVIYADSEIRIDEIAGAIGYIGSNGKIKIEKGETGAIEGDLWALDSIENKAVITVAGDVITNKKVHDKAQLTVTGTIFEEVNLPAVGLPQPVFEFSRRAPDREARLGSPLDLEPGSYGRIRVDKGAVLRLAGGEYAIKELDTGDHALILIQGPVEIHVRKNLDIDDYVEWMITGETSTRDVKVYLHGKKAEIDDHAVIRATMIAPRAKVKFKKYSRLHGAVFARKIELDEGVYLYSHDHSQSQPAVNHRSIGIRTGALYETGTVTATANSNRVTFADAELPPNIGRGDRIIFNPAGADQEILYIHQRVDKNELILQSPAEFDHTAAAYTIERAYNAIQSWEDDRQGDLVAENRREIGVCYNDGPFVSDGAEVLATIDGSNTDSSRYLHLTVSDSQWHYGLAGSGVVLDGQDTAKFGIRVKDDYTIVGHLELKHFRNGRGAAAVEVEKAKKVRLEQLLIHNFQSGQDRAAGIRGAGKSDFRARNCTIYDGGAAGIENDGKGGTAFIQNCTIYNMTGRGVHEDKGTYIVQNTMALANGREDFKIKRGRQSHNLSSDDTAAGPGSLNHMMAADQFVSIASGELDLHLKADADAVDKGFDLSIRFGADIDGDRRPVGTAWDIGADEYLVPPAIEVSPVDRVITEKEPVTFSVTATGSYLQYQWQKKLPDEVDFVSIDGETAAEYTIPVVTYAENAVQYRCMVYNRIDRAFSEPATLSVNLLPPDINTQPTDAEVTEFKPATFTVTIAGTLLEYQWQRSPSANDPFVDIAGATEPTYTIGSAQYDDSRFVYRCRVTNIGNEPEYSDAAGLKVNLLPPVIQTQPVDVTATEKQPAIFSIDATGTLLQYQWRKERDKEDGRSEVIIIDGANQPSYKIDPVQYKDSHWKYRCVVSNIGNSVPSAAVELTVNLLPPVIETQPVDTVVTENQRAEFSVSATGRLLEYQWQRKRIDENGNLIVELIAGANHSLYTIDVAEYDDSAWQYLCLVTNIGNEVVSEAADLTVNLLPPIIESQPADTEVTEKDPATFSISATGTMLKYQWQLKLAEAPEEDPFEDIADATGSSFTIAAVKYEDRLYIYRCRVSNFGNDPLYSDAAGLTVNLLPPVVTKHPKDTEITEKQSASFSVIAEGTLLEYQWQKKQPNAADFEDITNATKPQYAIPVVEYTDRGQYRCVVTNLADGVSSLSATLTVKLVKPEIQKQPANLTINEGDPVELAIEALGTLLTYQWQRKPHGEDTFVDIAGANAARYAIATATLPDHGTYRCLVSNIDWPDVPSHQALLFVEMKVPENATPISNPSASWKNAHARLAWNSVQGFTYRIYQGVTQDNIAAIADSNDAIFSDPSSKFYNTYYYQLATVKHHAHPYADKVYESVGPRSDVMDLKALPVPVVTIAGAEQKPDGKFNLPVGINGPYEIQGTYALITGDMTVQATKAGATNSGSGGGGGGGGIFSIQLPEIGTWEIKVSENLSGKYNILTLILVKDEVGPDLAVDGPPELTSVDNYIVVAGVAADKDSGLDSVVITSSRYTASSFGAIVDSLGKFSAEIPLKFGANQLSVIARDKVGNQSQQAMTVTVQPTALPRVIIHEPASGATVAVETIDMAGEVRSSLPAEQIRLELAGQIAFPTGADGEYTFEFKNIRLAAGPNNLAVQATTPYGTVRAQATVHYLIEDQATQPEPPSIEIDAQGPEIYVTEDFVVVQGTAGSDAGIQQVTVNGQEVDLIGSTNYGTFESLLQFTDPDPGPMTITVEVTDENGQTSTVTYVVRHDSSSPVIEFADPALQPMPAVNTVGETPYTLSGTVSDENLAGFSINDQNVALLPAPAGENRYTFETGIPLVRGTQMPLTLAAWDHAGNRFEAQLTLQLDAALDIEVISPRDGSELSASADTLDAAVTVRVPGLAAGDRVRVRIDDAAALDLSLTGATANGTLTVSDGDHRMAVEVVDENGTVLARQTSRFSVVNTAGMPLTMERQEPANSETGVEPNAFIAFYFNKPIDPQQLQIQVLETVHGLNYEAPEKGADITQLSEIELVEVHRDREPVPGGLSHFPGNTMAAYYPQRDLAYGATVYVEVMHNNEALARTSFDVRPLPTFIQGFVADQFMQPIAGVAVEIPELGRTASTDGNGSYGFGFGDQAHETIPAGRYRGVVNPNLSNRSFGTVERWINVEGGRLNSVGMTLLPILNPEEPFRHIASGQQAAVLAGGDLTLGLADAGLIFPDGNDEGDVHVQFMKLEQIAYPTLPSATPNWALAVQPMGVEVRGPVALTFAMPPLYGSHDYVAHIGERVVLVGYDPAALQLVPVGVGLVDADNNQVTSEGEVALERLDYLGYALVDVEEQAILERFANGEINLRQMIGELETN